MRPKTVLALFVVVAALVAFIWFYERDLPSSDERGELAKKAIAFDRDAVQRIELESEGERVLMVRVQAEEVAEEDESSLGFIEDEWQLEEPFQGRADSDLVASLLDAVESLEKVRELTGLASTEAGLDTPRATLVLHTDEGARELLVGSEVPASETMIVSVDGGEPMVVSKTLWSSLDQEPGNWRGKDLYFGERDAIESVVLETEQGRLRLARRGDAFWIEEPLSDRADRARVRALLGAIVASTVHAFVDHPEGPLADFGLDPPVATVEVTSKDVPETFRLEWGRPVTGDESRSFARMDGQLFETSAPLAEYISSEPESWRSLDLITFETQQIDSIRVLDGEGELQLRRAGADWMRSGETISFTEVSDLLYALADAKASGARGPAAGEEPEMWGPETLEVALSDGEREETVLFGSVSEGRVLVRTGERAVVLVVDANVLSEIQQKLSAVRSAEPLGAEDAASEVEDLEDSGDRSQ
jgi:hypothetical protein